ncbi:hypothetical protein GCM10022409_38510 [Hymenobacter glaciei]|uniref:Dienelactone hydrolase domain-containing protein n=1 Tax=Hymenobacter glaciei TaxID=877209 RepID=A0ABP7UNI9_9BACT
MLRLTALFILCIFAGAAYAGPGFAGLKPGPHGVGFRVVKQYDYSRTYKEKIDLVSGLPAVGERARPLQTLVWYPAPKAGTPVRYADYLRTEATDEVFERSTAEIDGFVAAKLRRAGAALGAKQAQAVFEQRMWAVRDAAASSGKFPVVIYAPGRGGTAHELADIGEYLAGHGYVVLASRSLGTRTPLMNTDREGIDTQVRDLQFLLAYAQSLPQADLAHVAAVGWSWGGMVNVFTAAQDSRITALVSFDGTREPEFTRQIDPARVALPWLYIQKRAQTVSELSREGIETSFSLLNALKYSNVYQVVMNPMEHFDFSSALLRVAPSEHFVEYSRAEVEAAYHWTCRYTLEFLNAYLKGDAAGVAFLERPPAQNGVPLHTARMQHTPAQTGPLPTHAGFAVALAARGFGHALEVYRQIQQQDTSFSLSEGTINIWGYQLMSAHNLPAALAIFQLGTTLYPSSANLFDSLGEAEENNHDTPAAIQHYRRSLELNPGNTNARQRLQALAAAK